MKKTCENCKYGGKYGTITIFSFPLHIYCQYLNHKVNRNANRNHCKYWE